MLYMKMKSQIKNTQMKFRNHRCKALSGTDKIIRLEGAIFEKIK